MMRVKQCWWWWCQIEMCLGIVNNNNNNYTPYKKSAWTLTYSYQHPRQSAKLQRSHNSFLLILAGQVRNLCRCAMPARSKFTKLIKILPRPEIRPISGNWLSSGHWWVDGEEKINNHILDHQGEAVRSSGNYILEAWLVLWLITPQTEQREGVVGTFSRLCLVHHKTTRRLHCALFAFHRISQ